MDQVTQQNAALVEQSTAAAQSLKEQADRLAQTVEMFNVSREQAQSAISQARAATWTAVAVEPAPRT